MPRPSKKTKPKASDKRGPGQPEKDIDLKQLEILCQMQATSAEIAAWFNCSIKTIERHRAKPEFKDAMDNGRLKGLVSLRRAQYQAALNGNTTMLVWLGKQLLSQRDRPADESQDREPITRVQYEWVAPVPEDPAEKPDDQLPKPASDKGVKTGAILQ